MLSSGKHLIQISISLSSLLTISMMVSFRLSKLATVFFDLFQPGCNVTITTSLGSPRHYIRSIVNCSPPVTPALLEAISTLSASLAEPRPIHNAWSRSRTPHPTGTYDWHIDGPSSSRFDVFVCSSLFVSVVVVPQFGRPLLVRHNIFVCILKRLARTTLL
jgi:hypothetical protein